MEILTITFMVSALYTILCSKKSSKSKNVAFACWQDCDKSEMKLRESDNSNDIESRTRRNNKTNSGCTSCNVNPFKFTEKQEKTDRPIKSSRSNKKHESVISSRDRSHKNNKFHDSRISGKVISGKNSKEPIFFPSDKNLIFVKTDKPCFKPDRIDDFCNKKDKRKCFKDCEFPTSCSSDSKSCTTDSSCFSESSCSSTSSSCSSSDKVQENTGCYERIMCKENDLICKEVKKEFAITENNLLVMMNNYICNVENIIMTNVSTILDNPEKYVPLTIGAAELEALITTISTDGNGITTQAADALRNARLTALTNITNCLRKLMICEKEQLRRIFRCFSVRDLQTNLVNFQITTAINNIIINVRKCITQELNAMVATQKEILIAASKQGNWANLNTYLADIDTIRTTMETALITSIGTMATDAATVNNTITAQIQALTAATQTDVVAMLTQFVDAILALLFVNPPPFPIALVGNVKAPAISPYVPKPSDVKPSQPKPTNPDQSMPGPSAPDLNDLDSIDGEDE